jgi:phage gp36-like protein
MPITLPNLYCQPQDVYEFCGIEAAQLRLDDRNLASGQQISATSTAGVGATSINVSALQYPLLLGSNLVFTEASMAAPVEVTLTSPALAGATSLTFAALTTSVVTGAVAIDNGVNVWLGGMLVKACSYATARIKSYCCNRYNDSDLVKSWSVNQWATVIAARWLGKRRYQLATTSIEDDYKEVMEELVKVQCSQLNIEDIGTRTSGWPFMSNISLDLNAYYRKAVVEPAISEPTQTQYPQSIDWSSYFSLGIY